MRYSRMDLFLDVLFVLAVCAAIIGLFELMDDTKDPVAHISQIKEECVK